MNRRIFCNSVYTVAIALLLLTNAMQAQSVVTGSLSTRIDSLVSSFPDNEGTNEYQTPSAGNLTSWGGVITKMLNKDFSGANTDASALGYHVTQFNDNTTSPNVTYYILEKNSASSNHWGVFVFNPNPRRPKLVIEAPHPMSDLNTEKQARQIFMRNGARMLSIAGTHRCNSSSFTTCSGTTTACSDTAQKYRLSDQAHIANSTFQKTTEILKTKIPGIIVIQPHGFGKDAGDPDVIMSNGTRYTPTNDYLVSLRNNLQTIDATLTYKIAHVDLTWTKLIATENTQGRYINGSVNPCSNSASSTNGRFLHLEQAYSKLRDTETNRKKLSDAIGVTFPADTLRIISPNGGESWAGGSVHSITWSSTGLVDSVKLEYTLNNGGAWKTIVASTPNTGTYSWTVPSAGSWRARVRVTDIANTVTTDISNAQCTLTFAAWPISGTTSSSPIAAAFGPRMLSGVYDFHRGIDMPGALQTPIHPAKAGVIVRMEDTSVTVGTGLERYGNWILVKHETESGSPRHTGYLHLNAFHTYRVGDTVSTADTIGFMGKSGVGINTIHIHLEYYKNLSGTSIDKDKIYNPIEILSYSDANAYIVTTFLQGDSSAVDVLIPSGELDFDEVTMYGTMATRTVGLNSRTGIDPVDNDNPSYNNVYINPSQFTVDSSFKRIRFWTKLGTVGSLDSIRIKDVKGYTATFVEYSGQRFAVTSGNWDDAIWAGSLGGVPGSVPAPSRYDDIYVTTGTTVTINSATPSCRSVVFQDSTASLALANGGTLNVYGNFTIASSGHKAFSTWATGAKLRFTGASQQWLSGWSTTSNTADSTILMEIVVDKSGDTLKTPGADMKLGLGRSLEIVNGVFMLGYRDDINGRISGASSKPTITVGSGGVFYVYGSLSSIRSGTSGQNPIGMMTVRGKANLATTSTIGICIDGVTVLSGGELHMESFSNTAPNNVLLDTILVQRGGELWNSSTVNFWGGSVVAYLDTGAMYRVTTSTTNFPPTFYNTGTVRYQRTAGDGSQTIADMNYHRLEVSYGGTKTWTLGANRTIADSLEINNSTNFVLTAARAKTLNLNGTLRLTSGALDNSNANVALVLANGALISRATGTIASAPTFGSSVNVRYSSTTTSVASGPELPVSSTVLKDLTIFCDTTTVTLTAPATVNGLLTLSNGILDNSASTLTFANGSKIRRATGTLTTAPVFAGATDVAYISTVSPVTTGFELPTTSSALDTFSIESPMNITLNSSATVNGALQFNRGLLYLGDYSVILAATATVTGTPSDTTMAVVTGTGGVKKMLGALPATFTLPIGDTVGGANYSPAVLTVTSGTVGANPAIGARVLNAKHPSNIATEDYLNRYWLFTTEDISDFSATLNLNYAQDDVHGSENSIVLGEWDGATWATYNFADTAGNTLSATVTELSEFTGISALQIISMQNGWNLISAPIAAENMEKTALFPTAVSEAFFYQGGYVIADTLQNGVGYWLKFSEAQDVIFSGNLVTSDTVTVLNGWNIIGSLSTPTPQENILEEGTNITSNFFEYNGSYQIAETLASGKGYWVKVAGDGALILSSPGRAVAKRDIATTKKSLSALKHGTLTVRDAKGRAFTLYYGAEPKGTLATSAREYEVPPPAPQENGEGFDVRFATNTFVETIAGESSRKIPVQITTTEYPVTLSWEHESPSCGAEIVINGMPVALSGKGRVTLPQASNTSLVLSGTLALPKEMKLEQNYPNPFNPVTFISYALMERSYVTLKIYDMLGREVATLVDGMQDAGLKTQEWNAQTLPSGVYYYRLQAGTFSASKKTLLVK